jgi:hypothetical protein
MIKKGRERDKKIERERERKREIQDREKENEGKILINNFKKRNDKRSTNSEHLIRISLSRR